MRLLVTGGAGHHPVDACLHFAALIDAGESMRRPEALFRVDTAGALTLLNALVDRVESVGRVTGRAVPLREEARRAGDPAVLVPSADRARRLVDWKPTRGPGAIIGAAWAWHARRWDIDA